MKQIQREKFALSFLSGICSGIILLIVHWIIG